MEYFSNNRKEDIKNKKNPSKIYIPLNTNRVNSNSKQLGSGFPDSKTIEFFSTVNRGIQTGLITLPTSTGDNIYTIDGSIPTGIIRNVLSPSGTTGLKIGGLGYGGEAQNDDSISIIGDKNGVRTSIDVNSSWEGLFLSTSGSVDRCNLQVKSNQIHLASSLQDFSSTTSFQINQIDCKIQFDGASNPRKGLRLVGLGEVDEEGTSGDYSTLVGTSLVPKRYVDDEIAFYGVDKIIEITTATHSVLGVNATYHVTAAGSTLTIQTSVISDGNRFRIKDAIGNASVNNIVIQTQGAELIDGDGAGVTINTDYGYIELYCFNNNLFIKQ